jgi:4-amino-4-deoxy-L-arabinose transferase-like glycosyltransferase
VAFTLTLAIAPTVFPERDANMTRNAQALADGTPDASGRSTPLLVHDAGEHWYQPLAVYPAALLMRIGVPPRIALRLPAMLAAAISALLTYLLALSVCQPPRIAAIALLLLVTAPAWAVYGAAGGADFLMVAAILGWLVSIVTLRDRMTAGPAVFVGVLLGLGAWTQPAGVLAVLLFFLVGVLLMTDRQRTPRVMIGAAAGAAVPVIVCALWLATHPDAYGDTFGRWVIHAAHIRRPWDGLIAVTRWDVMARRAGDYWAYLNPTFLFGGHALFGIGMSVLVAAGLWTSLDSGRWALALGFLATPLVAALLDMPRDASLVIMMAPLGAILAAIGVEWMQRQRGGRPLVIVVLVLIVANRAITALVG